MERIESIRQLSGGPLGTKKLKKNPLYNLGGWEGRLMQYADHNIQGFIPDQVGNLESTRLGQAQGNKLVLPLHPIAHLFGLICHTLELDSFIILQ